MAISEPHPSGIAPLKGWSAVVADGPDAAKFLQGFCTNDVQRLGDGRSCEAFFTDVKARVLAYGWIARFTERCVVLLSSDGAPRLAEHLDRYILRDDVSLSVVEWSFVLAWNEVDAKYRIPVAAFGESATVHAAEDPTRFGSASEKVLEGDAFEEFRIRLGVPRDGVDVDKRNLPQEVDRNAAAISLTKGCYLGQEPVARIDALGRVNWLLRGLRFSSMDGLQRDAELAASGKAIGRVTSFAPAHGGAVGLGYVRREHADPGTVLGLGSSEVEVVGFPISN